MVRTWLAPIFILLLFGGTTACQQGSGDDECIAGAVGCSCTGLGECLGGLQCLSNFCVDPSNPTSATANPSGSNTDATGSEPTSEPTTSDATSSDMTNPTAGESTSAPAGCMDPEGRDNNSPCTDPSGCGCASGHCALVPGFGGWCGECTEDAHCPDAGGCTLPDPFQKLGSRCSSGEYEGNGCQTDDACHDVEFSRCAKVFETPGGTVVRGCSECVTDDDCSGDNTCHPVDLLPRLAGYRRCGGQLPHGLCDNSSQCGDYYSFCVKQPVLNDLELSVCSMCATDADCVAKDPDYPVCKQGGWDPGIPGIDGSKCYAKP